VKRKLGHSAQKIDNTAYKDLRVIMIVASVHDGKDYYLVYTGLSIFPFSSFPSGLSLFS
jgi:hypothetical protein